MWGAGAADLDARCKDDDGAWVVHQIEAADR